MASMIRPDRAILKRQEEVAQPKLGKVFPEKNMVSTPSNDSFFFVNFMPIFGEMIQFDGDCFSNGWLNHHLLVEK